MLIVSQFYVLIHFSMTPKNSQFFFAALDVDDDEYDEHEIDVDQNKSKNHVARISYVDCIRFTDIHTINTQTDRFQQQQS